MKHAIIPTDFSIRSLQPVHDVMSHYGKEPVRITLLHLLDVPSGIGDLLFRLRRTDSRYPIPEDFRNAVEVLTNRYGSRIGHIRTALEFGNSTAFLRHVLEAAQADAVFVQKGLEFQPPFEESIDLMPLLPATGIRLVESAAPQRSPSRSTATISDLLLANG